MALLRRLFRGPGGQRVGHATGRAGRQTFGRLFEALLPRSAPVPLEDVRDVRRVLLVRPNFRIGNTLMTNAIIPALRARFPEARLEYLTGDTTVALLDGMPIDEIHPMSRSYVKRPWEFLALFRELRARSFDVAVEAGMGSFSGGLYAWLSGARWRIGIEGPGERFMNVLFPRPVCMHAYDDALEIGDALGMECADRPLYVVGDGEAAAALEVLDSVGLVADGRASFFVAVFVGGHLHKRWPNEKWVAFLRGLDAGGVPFVVCLGPEEAQLEGLYRDAAGTHGKVLPPQRLRTFAALLAQARVLVTPDSGPMHLGVAVETPTIAFLTSEDSRFYEPRGERDAVLVAPSAEEAVEAVLSHVFVREFLGEDDGSDQTRAG